jgi:hypothetical protein
MNKITILFLASDPANVGYRPRLGAELRDIANEIELTVNRDLFQLESELAVRPRDLQGAIMRHYPDIVHFSGHGGMEGIFLEDDSGNKKAVSKEALAQLFEIFKDNIHVVFLNACYTQSQIEAFRETIDFTIGMKEPVADEAAMKFAGAFYRALAYNYPVEMAFKLAVNQLTIDDLPNQDTPVLYIKNGVDATKSFFNPNCHTLSQPRSTQELGQPHNTIQENFACIWIHGWVKRIYDRLPSAELDWTKYFDRASRVIPDQETWDCHLYPELRDAKRELDKQGSFIDLRGKLPLTATLAIGAFFPEVGGYTLRAEQPTHGRTSLWRSDSEPSGRRFKVMSKKRSIDFSGNDVLIALSITGTALREVSDLYEQRSENFAAMLYAEPDNGPGDGALRSDGDAVALAIHAKELIRACKQEYNPSRVHLVVYAPAAYCLFLGQRLNALGEIATYERTLDEGYKPSVTIQTG